VRVPDNERHQRSGIGNVVLSIDTVTVGVTVSTVKAAVLPVAPALPARS
jgi:hypothetical protein